MYAGLYNHFLPNGGHFEGILQQNNSWLINYSSERKFEIPNLRLYIIYAVLVRSLKLENQKA